MAKEHEVLIVEDNPSDIRLMREALRDMQPKVILQIAMDGDEALRILRRQGEHAGAGKPSLIFLDFNLPKSDSREILRALKTDLALRVIPVAILTTSDSAKDIQDAYELFANCYLRKPLDLDSFLKTVREAAHFWLNVVRLVSE